MKQKAAFFDRDGTLIKDVHYLSSLDHVELLPGIVDFCLYLQQKDYLLFVVTNQSGIARGFFDEAFVQKTHRYISDIFAKHSIYFKKFYYCPHHPSENCMCRKPSPGMLELASCEYDLDLSKSLMFGDKECDIQVGTRVGCKSFYILDIINCEHNKTAV